MNKAKYKLEDIAKELDLKQSVIKQWEKDFALGSKNNKTNQKYFTDQDLKKFAELKTALLEKKLTLAQAKNIIEPAIEPKATYSAAAEIFLDNIETPKVNTKIDHELDVKLKSLRQQLLKLKESL